jgi:prepilin-type N-terminal cleavage/methylation domain-containing protein
MTKKYHNGFTLIEVVVASTVLALLMTGLYQLMGVGFLMWDRGQKEIDEQQNVRLASSQISREIRTAYAWDIGTAGPSCLPSDTIEMIIPESQDLGNYRRIGYYLNGGNILRDVNGTGHNVVAYGIKTLRFQGDANNVITLLIESESGFSVSTKAFIRVDRSFLFLR